MSALGSEDWKLEQACFFGGTTKYFSKLKKKLDQVNSLKNVQNLSKKLYWRNEEA